jgi:hypothetical protein
MAKKLTTVPVSVETMELVVSKFPELRPVMGAPLVPETQALEEAFTVDICTLKDFRVVDQQTCGQAAIHLANVKAWKANAEGLYNRFCEIFNYVHKWGTSRRAALAGQADPIIAHLNGQIMAWDDAEKTRVAREQAEFDRKKREYDAEQARLAAEQARLAEERTAALSAQPAAVADLFGDDEPVPVVSLPIAPPPVPPRPAQTALPVGVVKNLPYHAVITDYALFITWVAEDPTNRGKHAPPDMPSLNIMARAMEGNINIPGVRAERNRTVSG